MPSDSLPLSGVRVLAVEQYGAGPFGSMLLADLGADVLKIEYPVHSGDISRAVGPHFTDDGESLFFHSFNRNKSSLAIDLKHPDGRKVLEDLVANSDALYENLRGDVSGKLGLTYNDLSEFNRKIVCVHLSAYGREGSRRTWPGYDYPVQAETGYLSVTGEPDAIPTRMGLSIVDMMSGVMAALGLVSAVFGAERTGKGRDIDVSLFDTALHNLSYLATWYLNANHVQGRVSRSGHPSLSPAELVTTADGWIFIMCNKPKFWDLLVDRLGNPSWAKAEEFTTYEGRLRNRSALMAHLDESFQTRTTAEWFNILGGVVPAGPVLDVAGALENQFVAERTDVRSYVRSSGPPVRMVSGPVRPSDAEVPSRAGPRLGEHTDTVLSALGYSEEQLRGMRERGVI